MSIDEMYIHDWLLYPDYMFHDGRVATIAIHKSVAGRRSDQADCSTHDPEDGVTRFGPGSLASSLSSIDDMHFDVIDVYSLYDEGYLNNNAHLIFKGGDTHATDIPTLIRHLSRG